VEQSKGREMVSLQVTKAFKVGDRSKAQKFMKRLNPDEENARDLQQYD
jgi:hypothetical protein